MTGAVHAPSAPEVEDYYDAAKSVQFTILPTYDLRLISNVERSKMEHALAALERDDSASAWKRLAERYSQSSAGEGYGGLYRATPAQFGDPIDTAIAAAPRDKPQGPIEGEGVFVVFEVEGFKQAETEPLEQARRRIVAALLEQEKEAALETFVYEFESKWGSRTRCIDGCEVEGCSSYRGTGHPQNAPPACYESIPAPASLPLPVRRR